MKLTIITVCLNSEKTIADTINSVNSQSYKNIEHIFVDGGSTDNTINILKANPNKKKKIYINKNTSIYEAMNAGIKKANGNFIQILNSDDILNSNSIIEEIVKKIEQNPKHDVFLGNVVYFTMNNFYKVNRFFRAYDLRVKNLLFGDMPPHPGSFVKKDIYKKYGLYNTKFKIASDYDFFLRIFKIHKVRFKFLESEVVRMRTGGKSDKNIKSYFITTKEILQSITSYNLKANRFRVIFRAFVKIKELFMYNEIKLNKSFELFDFSFQKKKYEKKTFKIFRSINDLNFKKNFILSGMNLAFLGYYCKESVKPQKYLFHWPDGIFTKKIININKVPGRDILKQIKFTKNIKSIRVIGNISLKSKNFLKKKYKVEIYQVTLPYAPINELLKQKITLKKSEIVFITLPTPKQEQFAITLANRNKNFKIICIGGSIAIASGEEREVPKILENYEFLWRLKNDFFRRIYRLFESLYFYVIGNYIYNLYNKTIFKIIEK